MNPHRFSASTAVAAAAVALATGAAAAAGAHPGAAPATPRNAVHVRTFTAPQTARVRAVDLVLDGGSTRHARVTVVIRALTPGGQPTRTVLAGTSTAAGDGRLRVQLPTPPAVRSGVSYALAVSAPAGTRIGAATPVYGNGRVAPACQAA